MKWFKHDATANMDHKLQDVLLDFGLEGYGLYWYCLEMIANNVKPDNLTFQLDHDVRMIARNVGSTPDRVREILNHFIKVGLFNLEGDRIVCAALAKRCDDFTAKVVKSAALKEGRKNLNNQSVGVSQTKSEKVSSESEKVPLEVEEIRSEESTNNSLSDSGESSEKVTDKTESFLQKNPEAAGGIYTPSGSKWGSAEDLRCAEYIFDQVRMVNSAAKEPKWPEWANHVRLMRQIDDRNHREICALMKWAAKDSFWCQNILSPAKLRKQWDTLSARRAASPSGSNAPKKTVSDILNSTDW